jgi:hypothetical protein
LISTNHTQPCSLTYNTGRYKCLYHWIECLFNLFCLVYYIMKSNRIVSSCRCVNCYVGPSVIILERQTGFHENYYKYLATRGHPTFVLFKFMAFIPVRGDADLQKRHIATSRKSCMNTNFRKPWNFLFSFSKT